MNGKMNDNIKREPTSFEELFSKQIEFQIALLSPDVIEPPFDSLYWFKYHCLAMMEEMGEVMKADKRWKTHRNDRYEPEEKLDELADVFITFMNLCTFSGFTSEEVSIAIQDKIAKNFERLNNKSKE